MKLEAVVQHEGITKGKVYIPLSGRIGYVTVINDSGVRREYPLDSFKFI